MTLPAGVQTVQFYIVANTTAADELWTIDDVTVGSSAPLPVELTAFEALRQNNAVLLKWATASEKNNDRFSVERSADGKDFKAIATVRGSGSTTKTTSYSVTDKEPLTGLNYYRLRQIDTEGQFSYSPVRVVQVGAAAFAYPSPATNRLNVPVALASSAYRVVNSVGQTVLRGVVPASGVVEVSKLPTGSYFLQIGEGKDQVTQRFLRKD
ncbi:T9SS type A sorting domain-containing protein [Hymenobacter persicinus]|uniref:T9SS type A sorting domain-containing protein n=1 Tax=Hymenobacter persicinus TaxID=2025506 RepID=UPI0013EACC8E|nr:T9SS type A sorting domain-containing protein [Hymenobacter persicinus]